MSSSSRRFEQEWPRTALQPWRGNREPSRRYGRYGGRARPRIASHGVPVRGRRRCFRHHSRPRSDGAAVRARPGRESFRSRRALLRGDDCCGAALATLRLAGRSLRRTDIAVTTALMVFTIPGALAASRTRQHTGQGLALREPLRALARQAAFVPVTIGLIGMTLIWGTFGAFAPIFAKEALGLPSFQVGLLLGLQAVFNAGSRPVAGRLVDRARRRWPIVLVGVIVWSAAMVVLGHLTGFLVPAIVIAIGTPFIATSFVAIGVVFGDLSGASTRGVTMGMYGTVLFLGLSAGPLVFGPIVQNAGYAAGFTACAVVSVLLGLVMAGMQAEPLRRRSEVPLPPAAPGT